MPKRIYLVGAGASVDPPSSIPPAAHILGELLNWIAGTDRKLASAVRKRIVVPRGRNPFTALRFEAFIEAIGNVVKDPLPVLAEISRHGSPNRIHHILAREIGRGARVVTTNFDTRIEVACRLAGIDAGLHILDHTAPDIAEDCRILKVHGSFDSTVEAPWATLLRIGQAGLAFSRFPQLHAWLQKHSENADLIVVGYSASDHFDVVPLIETSTRCASVSWMNYDPHAEHATPHEILSGASPIVPAADVGFADQILSALKFRSPPSLVRKVTCRSVADALALVAVDVDLCERASTEAMHSHVEDNLIAFRAALKNLPLDRNACEQLSVVLLEDDAFGAHLGPEFGSEEQFEEPAAPGLADETFGPAAQTLQPSGVSDEPERSSTIDPAVLPPNQAAHYWASIAAREQEKQHYGAFTQAALHMIEALVRSEQMVEFRADQMRAMMLADSFQNARYIGDLDAMREIRDLADQRFATTGHMPFAIAALIMEARRCHFEVTTIADVTSRGQAMIEGLHAAEKATYFALRSGRPDTMRDAAWLYAFFLEHTGNRQKAADLLDRFLTWIPANDAETRGTTLSNIHGLLLRAGDWKGASVCLSLMNAMKEKKWPSKRMFMLVARAERELRRHHLAACQRALARAYEALDSEPKDEQRPHREYLDRLKDNLAILLAKPRTRLRHEGEPSWQSRPRR